MNIFYTDSDPVVAANQLAYVHVIKMATEAAQMISTRIRLDYGIVEDFIYVLSRKHGKLRLIKKKNWYSLPTDQFVYRFGMKILVSKKVMAITHANHPSALWLRESRAHEAWVLAWARRLCYIYASNTGRIHAATEVLNYTLCYPPLNEIKWLRDPPACVPEHIKDIAYGEPVEFAYQLCLIEKYAEWGNRDKPIKVEFKCGEPHWYSQQQAM